MKDESGTWWSSQGTPLSVYVQERVNRELLAKLYASETDRSIVIDWKEVDSATRCAWDVGWLNPRVKDSG